MALEDICRGVLRMLTASSPEDADGSYRRWVHPLLQNQ